MATLVKLKAFDYLRQSFENDYCDMVGSKVFRLNLRPKYTFKPTNNLMKGMLVNIEETVAVIDFVYREEQYQIYFPMDVLCITANGKKYELKPDVVSINIKEEICFCCFSLNIDFEPFIAQMASIVNVPVNESAK